MHHGNQAAAGGLLMKYNRRTQSYTFNQLLTWGRSFNFYNIDLLVGHEFYAYKYEFLSAGKTNLVNGILELRPGYKSIQCGFIFGRLSCGILLWEIQL